MRASFRVGLLLRKLRRGLSRCVMMGLASLVSDFELSSDAVQLAVLGAAFWVAAGFCGVMEWRRAKRRDYGRLEKVGWVPWTPIFVMCAMIGGGCLAMSLPAVIANL